MRVRGPTQVCFFTLVNGLIGGATPQIEAASLWAIAIVLLGSGLTAGVQLLLFLTSVVSPGSRVLVAWALLPFPPFAGRSFMFAARLPSDLGRPGNTRDEGRMNPTAPPGRGNEHANPESTDRSLVAQQRDGSPLPEPNPVNGSCRERNAVRMYEQQRHKYPHFGGQKMPLWNTVVAGAQKT